MFGRDYGGAMPDEVQISSRTKRVAKAKRLRKIDANARWAYHDGRVDDYWGWISMLGGTGFRPGPRSRSAKRRNRARRMGYKVRLSGKATRLF